MMSLFGRSDWGFRRFAQQGSFGAGRTGTRYAPRPRPQSGQFKRREHFSAHPIHSTHRIHVLVTHCFMSINLTNGLKLDTFKTHTTGR